jgi:hypothetical protein
MILMMKLIRIMLMIMMMIMMVTQYWRGCVVSVNIPPTKRGWFTAQNQSEQLKKKRKKYWFSRVPRKIEKLLQPVDNVYLIAFGCLTLCIVGSKCQQVSIQWPVACRECWYQPCCHSCFTFNETQTPLRNHLRSCWKSPAFTGHSQAG